MIKEQIERAADAVTAFCHCAGPTCSGCEETSKKLFIRGANFVLERAKILEEALEFYAKNCSCSNDIVCEAKKAKSALEKWRGDGKEATTKD